MGTWFSYTEGREQHSVVGELLVTRDVYSPQLKNSRKLLVWLPSTYHTTDKRLPVLYMHDGDNLFDSHVSYSGEWQVDETLSALSEEGIEAIVVGLPNMGYARLTEYNPFASANITGRGDNYLKFIVETVKPMIDTDFRTRPEPAATGIVGSSMGGLISLYGFLNHPAVFGLCGSFSPVFWLGGEALYHIVHSQATGQGRVYLDVGTGEGEVIAAFMPQKQYSPEDAHRAYRDGVRQLRDDLLQNGYTTNLLYVEDEKALHNEAAWARRLPTALRFLLKQ